MILSAFWVNAGSADRVSFGRRFSYAFRESGRVRRLLAGVVGYSGYLLPASRSTIAELSCRPRDALHALDVQ